MRSFLSFNSTHCIGAIDPTFRNVMNTTFTAQSFTTDALPSFFSSAIKNFGNCFQGSVGCGTAGALGFFLMGFRGGALVSL